MKPHTLRSILSDITKPHGRTRDKLNKLRKRERQNRHKVNVESAGVSHKSIIKSSNHHISPRPERGYTRRLKTARFLKEGG